MPDLSLRLREPLVLTILIIAVAGWLAFFAIWINAASTSGTQQQTIAALTTERDEVSARLSEQETAQGNIETLNAQIALSQQDLAANTASLETVKTELTARQSELETTNAGLETARTEAQTLQDQADAAQQATTALATQQQELQAQIEAGNQQLTDVGSRLAAARQLEATATANAAQLTTEAATTTSALADQQAQLQSAREQQTAIQSQLTDLAAQSEAAGSDLVAIQQQVTDFQTRRDQLSAEVDSYQSQRDTLQPQVDQLTQTLADRGNELAALEQRIAEGVATADTAADTGRFVVSSAGTAQGLSLTLGNDGAFELRNRTGRDVTGQYTLDDQQLVLTNATGNLGNATFPMTCPVTRSEGGLTIGDADGCVLAGLEFSRAP